MTYVFDIDGTICEKPSKVHDDGSYSQSMPNYNRINKINQLYAEGHTIHFLTARGMCRSENKSPNLFRDITEKQLKDWGVNYDELFMGKPAGDFYIDDKGVKDEEFFKD